MNLTVSYRLWVEHGEGFTAFNKRTSRRTFTRIASAVVAACALLALIVTVALQTTDSDRGAETDDDDESTDVSTAHYRFRYLPADRAGAIALSAVADEAHQALRAILRAANDPVIVASLTEESDEHLGIAGWHKMRIERGTLTDPVERAHTLYHETTHVLAATESDRRLIEHGDDGQFFSEGLAEWTSHEIMPNPESESALWTQAATAWQRFGMQFDDLLSGSSFVARYDE